MSYIIPKRFENTDEFAAFLLRYTFGIMFLLVAVKKIRMGYGGFADSLLMGDTLLAAEAPSMLILAYGLILPGIELLVGAALLLDYNVKYAYIAIGFIYLSFVFGQMYNGNTVKVGTEYFPSILALIAAFYFYDRA